MKLGLVLSFAVVACIAPRPPDRAEYPFVAAGPYGEVRAHDGRVARSVEAHARWVAPRVARLLQVERVDFAIEVSSESLADGVLGKTIFKEGRRGGSGTRIQLGPDADLYILAHELTHVHAGGVWEALPHAVEEGLADVVAAQLDPHCAPIEFYRQTLVDAAERDSFDVCVACIAQFDMTRWKGLTELESSVLYAVGYMLAVNIGVPELRALCSDVPSGAEVDLRRLFHRAGIDPDAPRTWAAAVTRP